MTRNKTRGLGVEKNRVVRLSKNPIIDAVMLAAERAANSAHEEMKRGLNSLALITSIAPLLGLLITLDGIFGSFMSVGTEKSTALAMVADRLSNAVARSALGLLVGILSLVCYRYLEARLADFVIEMRNTTLDLANALSALPKPRRDTP